jgi:hypothetical protein
MVLVGSRVTRVPAESTPRYTQWINKSQQEELWLQQYREVTMVQPTWFLRKSAFLAVGGYGIEASPKPPASVDAAPGSARLSKGERKRAGKVQAALNQGLVKRSFPSAAALDSGVCVPGVVDCDAVRVQCAGIAAFNAYCHGHFEARIKQAKVAKRSAAAAAEATGDDPVEARGSHKRPRHPMMAVAGTGVASNGALFHPTGPAHPLAAAAAGDDDGTSKGASAAAAAAGDDDGTSKGASAAAVMQKGSTRVQFPEDLLFLLAFAAAGGSFVRVDESLLRYRCTPGSVSWNIPRRALLAVRTAAFEVRELRLPGPLPLRTGGSPGTRWEFLGKACQDLACRCLAEAVPTARAHEHSPMSSGFSVWGAGRDGSQFLSSLSPQGLALVRCCGDIDPKKLAAGSVLVHPMIAGSASRSVPVVAIDDLPAPVVTCVALNRGGEFEARLGEWMKRSGGVRGLDVWHVI